MKKARKWLILIVLGFNCLGTGCSSLSLFTSRHTHYHGTDEINQRLSGIESRLAGIENANSSPPATPATVAANP